MNQSWQAAAQLGTSAWRRFHTASVESGRLPRRFNVRPNKHAAEPHIAGMESTRRINDQAGDVCAPERILSRSILDFQAHYRCSGFLRYFLIAMIHCCAQVDDLAAVDDRFRPGLANYDPSALHRLRGCYEPRRNSVLRAGRQASSFSKEKEAKRLCTRGSGRARSSGAQWAKVPWFFLPGKNMPFPCDGADHRGWQARDKLWAMNRLDSFAAMQTSKCELAGQVHCESLRLRCSEAAIAALIKDRFQVMPGPGAARPWRVQGRALAFLAEAHPAGRVI